MLQESDVIFAVDHHQDKQILGMEKPAYWLGKDKGECDIKHSKIVFQAQILRSSSSSMIVTPATSWDL